MRIILTINEAIKMLDVSLHAIAIVIGTMIGTIVCGYISNMYIGKLILVYAGVITLTYIIIRVILCSIFKPIIRLQKERMSH